MSRHGVAPTIVVIDFVKVARIDHRNLERSRPLCTRHLDEILGGLAARRAVPDDDHLLFLGRRHVVLEQGLRCGPVLSPSLVTVSDVPSAAAPCPSCGMST
eukprot:CAMPEP_0182927416 /NCGR_PEP_ID=MMETSP0105_2-20130417/13776_1 /TAXON_ID=81532 ORGANISM="Acanthoeca-like sp., Strain 10tr" /NCGR_SAMPLE_ID=MMETSP0105_2 /ASSEMBLY_ACC=CAM_ASM_000205 /LENGTH=100 /DNA_ID=CAMNT_0025065363 /DNA_START=14 /DNA_END=313 /DNA_ORIENTATION=+